MEFEIADSFPESHTGGRNKVADWDDMVVKLKAGKIILINASQVGERNITNLRQLVRHNMSLRGVVADTTYNEKGLWVRKQKSEDA